MNRWKPSVFNLFIENEHDSIIYNTSSGNMLKLSSSSTQHLRNTLGEIARTSAISNQALLQSLITTGFVVSQATDEFLDVQNRFLKMKNDDALLRLAIAPTMQCNMNCSYCFQRGMADKESMTPAMLQAVVDFVRHVVADSKQLVVQWFGGEPLMAYEDIVWLSKQFKSICSENKIGYYSEMLSNGILLTSDVVDSFADISLRALQLSVDGDVASYAKRKSISVNQAASHYDRIFSNIQKIVSITGSVTIRINVDRDNPNAGVDTVRLLKEYGCNDPRIDIRLGFINSSRPTSDCLSHDCFTNFEFAELETEFLYFLANEGYTVFGAPTNAAYACSAALSNSYTIDASGRIGKCVPAMGTDKTVFARIRPGDMARTYEELSSVNRPFADFNPFLNSPCSDCVLIPVCYGSCPMMHEHDSEFICRKKDGFSEKVRFFCDYLKMGQESDSDKSFMT